ncbi:MAG: hypothetical protein WD768_01065 [Phycisphaeraceae bacterium]
MFDHFPTFTEVFDKFADPARMHAMLVHAPIVLTLLGFVLVIGVAITGSKSAGLRWTTVFIFMLATLAALWTVQSGEDAEAALKVAPTGVAHDVLEKHEHLAEPFWIAMAVTGGLVLLSTVRVTWFRTICLVLAILASAASVLWVGAIAHWGGEMVYFHQIGTGPDAHKQVGSTPAVPVTPVTPVDPDKDKAKDPEKDAATKDANKDAKDGGTKDTKTIPGERVLPDPNDKGGKNIFD